MNVVIENTHNNRYIISFLFYILKKWNIVFAHSVVYSGDIPSYKSTGCATVVTMYVVENLFPDEAWFHLSGCINA
jgi:hypothetical protein